MIYDLETLQEVPQVQENKPCICLHERKEKDLSFMGEDHPHIDWQEFLNHASIRYEEEEKMDLLCLSRNLCQEDNEDESIHLSIHKRHIHVFAQSSYHTFLLAKLENMDKEKRVHIGIVLHSIFLQLIKDYQIVLERIAEEIESLESRVMNEKDATNHSGDILHYRKQLLLRGRRYEQITDVLDYLLEDNNELYSEKEKTRFSILRDRTQRMSAQVVSLLEYVTEIRESYQSSLDIKQNRLMGIFTIVSTIFLPLTLLVGWYGMNFNMPEFKSDMAYPIVIIVSVAIVVFCICFFRKKKWF